MKFIMRVAVLLIICLFIGYNTDLFFFSKSVEKNTAEDTATKSNFPDNKKKQRMKIRNKCKIVPAWQDLLIKT